MNCSSLTETSYKIRNYKEIKLSNGLRVLLLKDKSLPYFSLEMLVDSGSIRDPLSKSGLASMVADLLEKGTTKRTALNIADDLGQIGASFSASVAKDYSVLTASSLSYHQDVLLENFIELVTQPKFSNSEIKRLKEQTLASLKQSVDQPAYLASLAFNSYLYTSHPYGRRGLGSPRDIKSIQKKHIIKFYRKFFRPNNSVLAVVGNFDESIVKKIEEGFKAWKPRPKVEVVFPKLTKFTGRQIQLIDKADLKQSQIRIGHFGINRKDKDFLSLRIANSILGGGFSSRLMNEIRIKRGLTYSIRSNFNAYLDQGPFVITTFSRNDKVGESLRETLKTLEVFREKGISSEELKNAKGLLIGGFPRAIETAEKLAYNLLFLRFYKIPDSYLSDYISDIKKISVSDVNRAIKKHLDPKNIKILVYSPKKKTLDQIRDIGIVEVKSYREFL